jgi:hypothetical protein
MAAKAKTSQAVSNRKTGGRPSGPWAGKPWRDALRLAALQKLDDDRKGRNKLEQAAIVLFGEALKGDVPALKEIGDRLDGKVPQALVGGGDDDNPVRVITEIRRTIVDPGQKGS